MRKCPYCSEIKIKCIETRTGDEQTRRRYKCISCGKTYSSVERYASDPAGKFGKKVKSVQEVENSKVIEDARNSVALLHGYINLVLDKLNSAASSNKGAGK